MRILQTLGFKKDKGGYHFTLKLDGAFSEASIVQAFDAALSSLGHYKLVEEKSSQYLVNSDQSANSAENNKYAEFKFFRISDDLDVMNLSVTPLNMPLGQLERILATIILPGLQPCRREQLGLFQPG